MLWPEVETPGIMQDSWRLLCGTVHTGQDVGIPGSHHLNANRLCSNHLNNKKCLTPHPGRTTLPIPVEKPWLTWEDCRQENHRRHVACWMVWSWWGWKQIQLRNMPWADLICIHSITSPKTPPLKSRDCNISQPPRELRVDTLTHAVFFHLMDIPWVPACYVSSKPCACYMVIYCWQNQTWSLPMKGLQSCKSVHGETGN